MSWQAALVLTLLFAALVALWKPVLAAAVPLVILCLLWGKVKRK